MKGVALVLIGALVLIVVVPIAALIFGSFWSESPVSSAGYLTLTNWAKAFRITIPQTVPRLFLTSVLFAFLVAFLSVFLGTGMAFLVERTDLPHGKFFEQIAILPRSFPVLIAALAWIMLLSPRIGVLNLILKKSFGLPPLNIYSFPGMVFLMVLYESPIVFLMVLNGFRLLDSSLEEQSLVCGNSIAGTLWRVTLPVMRPVILSAFMLVFIIGMITLEIPILIGMPRGIFVFTSAIYELIATDYQSLVYYNIAAALAMMLIPMTMVVLFLYRHAVKHTESFVTMSGKLSARTRYSLGRWRYPVLTSLSLYCFLVIILPVVVIVLISFSEFIASPNLDLLGHLTLRHWRQVWHDPVIRRALSNTVILSLTGATMTVSMSLALGYLLIRSNSKIKGFLEATAMLPLAVPGTILAIGFVWAYIRTPIYGTLWILLLYFVGNYLPFALRTLSPFLFQFHRELEEASWVCGASKLRTFVRIVAPLLRGGLFSVWILLFQIYLREFAGAIILVSFGTEVLSTLLFLRAFGEGFLGIGAVLGVLMLAMSLLLHAVAVRRIRVLF